MTFIDTFILIKPVLSFFIFLFFIIILIIFTPNFVDNVVYTHRGGRKRSFRYLVLFVCFCLFNVAIGVE
jgi:hypothetical protein